MYTTKELDPEHNALKFMVEKLSAQVAALTAKLHTLSEKVNLQSKLLDKLTD